MAKKLNERQSKWQGSKWITRERRLAIYARDGFACCYCGSAVEDGAVLSLDHLRPHCQGGDGSSTNLVTCCKKCNSARGKRSVAVFAKAVATYLDIDYRDILRHVRNCSRRKVNIAAARELIARRGSYSAALAAKRA